MTKKYKSQLYNIFLHKLFKRTIFLIIEQLKEAGRQADDKYVKDLKRQNKDVELIGKRMEQHVKEMTGKFQESLKKVESSLLTDRNETASGALNKSENAWKARALREIEMVYRSGQKLFLSKNE